MKQKTEVCAYSLESCLTAQESGADRVELCAAMYEGGLTPSAATIRMAREMLEIELFVMIRPRGGDFLYSELEYRQMEQDLLFAKSCGVDGVVLGILKADGSVDVERTRRLVELAAPVKVTFHRAFDMAADYRCALECVIEAGCHRILTSGGQNTAMAGVGQLRELVRQAAGRIQVMAGSGVCAANAVEIAATGVNALHLSGKKLCDSGMVFRNPHVSMGGTPGIPEYGIACCDAGKIIEVVRKLQQMGE